jgi:histidinol-phosphatase (PHP family)
LLVKDYLEEIAQYGYQVEINSKSYPTLNTFYPDERYFEMMHSLGIKVQVNSDSHYPDRINNGRQEALVALKKAGYKEVMEWHNGVWTEQEIDIS